MRRAIRTSLPLLASVALVSLISAHDAVVATTCPPPSESQGGQCVLLGTATLADTMWIPSATTLNCQGHRIQPTDPGSLDDPTTPMNEFQPSQPPLALFVHQASGVKIQNCEIAGFDFGIMVARSKSLGAPSGTGRAGTKILDNVIDVRTFGIDIIKSDGVLVSGNRIIYASERGRGVVIDYDSDDNRIVGNTIVSTDAASTGLVRQLPGGPFVTATAIMDNQIHLLQADKPLQNFVVSGTLVQIPAADPSDPEDSERTDHNLVEDNDIIDLGTGPSCTLDPGTSCVTDAECSGKGACLLKQNSGVGFNFRAADNVVRGNRLSGSMDRGISFGGVAARTVFPDWTPGTCSLDVTRLCVSNSDCSLPDFDTTGVGTCSGTTPATIDGTSVRLIAEANVLSGGFSTAALFANNSAQFSFRGNTVTGGQSGIRVNAAIGGSIERNLVSGAGNALYLAIQPAFTHLIRLNDFTGYTTAVRTSNAYSLLTELSAGGAGNYWGLSCPGFDPTKVRRDNGTVNPVVTDSHPYGEPVARTPDRSRPAPCQ